MWKFDETGGPEELYRTAEELPDARDLGPGEALVEIDAVGLNRADLLFLAGRYIYPAPSPSCLGQEAAGRIVAVGGEDGTPAPPWGALREGDQVGLLVGRIDQGRQGSYRTAGVYSRSALLPLPKGFDGPRSAALWVNALTAVGGLRAGGLSPAGGAGKTVLVTAASSGVGLCALQVARAWGARTLAFTTSLSKRDALAAYADRVLVAGEAEHHGEAVLEASGGDGVDLAFDPVGFANADWLPRASAVDGQIVFYGIMAGTEAPLDLVSLLRKDLSVQGFTIYRLHRRPERLAEAVADVLTLADAGSLEPRVHSVYAFDEAPAALAALAENRHLGKIVLQAG